MCQVNLRVQPEVAKALRSSIATTQNTPSRRKGRAVGMAQKRANQILKISQLAQADILPLDEDEGNDLLIGDFTLLVPDEKMDDVIAQLVQISAVEACYVKPMASVPVM
jgi:hypothetical protein